MLSVVLIYCLVNAPDQCVERQPVSDNFPSLSACLIAGQQIAATESEAIEAEHLYPGYRLSGINCVPAGQEKLPA